MAKRRSDAGISLLLSPRAAAMDAEYLQQTVGPALERVLAHLVRSQPDDPIAELAHSLRKVRTARLASQPAPLVSCPIASIAFSLSTPALSTHSIFQHASRSLSAVFFLSRH